jgi:hypothetical protein
MRTVWVLLVGLGFSWISLENARAAPGVPASKQKKKEEPMDAAKQVTLVWSMTPVDAGKRLHIDYTIKNHGKARIYVYDDMVVVEGDSLARAPQAIDVVNGDQPGVVRLVRGYVPSASKINIEYNPGVRPLEPGQELKGSAETALPLQAWHSYGRAEPLTGKPTSAVLEIHYFAGNHGLTTEKIKGGTMKKPARPDTDFQVLRSEPRPLP